MPEKVRLQQRLIIASYTYEDDTQYTVHVYYLDVPWEKQTHESDQIRVQKDLGSCGHMMSKYSKTTYLKLSLTFSCRALSQSQR